MLNVTVPDASMVCWVGVGPVAMPEVLMGLIAVSERFAGVCPKATWKAPQPISASVKNHRIVTSMVFSTELGMFFE